MNSAANGALVASNALGVYIHIPFCEKKCDYCDFYSITDTSIAESYTLAVLKEIDSYNLAEVDTLYIGGGTPLMLGAENLVKIISKIDARGEVTVEVNPCSTIKDDISALFAAGVNRLSVGVQSFCDTELSRLSRRHSGADAAATINTAYEVGFRKISADLILGLGTREELDRSLAAIDSLPLTHISAYILKTEPNTPFYEKGVFANEDKTADDYLYVCSRLEDMGYPQYEISNFGVPSVHNLKYWHRDEYLGIGCAAHSFYGGKEFFHERDIHGYISTPTETSYSAADSNPEFTRFMLRLRLREWNKIPNGAHELTKKLLQERLAEVKNDEFMLTAKGMLVQSLILDKFREFFD
jgi:putative oxygen-independent coproporphyrinogen III oxidase